MEVETVDLLHPEILSKEALIDILRKRSVRLDRPKDMNKDSLVEIFYRTVLPLPQRDFRDNRRGKIMAKLRPKKRKINDLEKYVKNLSSPEGVSPSKKRASEGTSGLITSASIKSTTSRLKPPPVVVHKNKSVVRLNPKKDSDVKSISSSSSSNSSSSSSSSSNISSSSPTGKTIIKLSNSSSGSKSDHKPESKKVSLKRLSSEKMSSGSQTVEKKKITLNKSPAESSEKSKADAKNSTLSSSSSSDSSPTKKKQIKRISWP